MTLWASDSLCVSGLCSLPWIHWALATLVLGSAIDLCALVYFSTQRVSLTESFLASIQTFWCLFSWALPTWPRQLGHHWQLCPHSRSITRNTGRSADYWPH